MHVPSASQASTKTAFPLLTTVDQSERVHACVQHVICGIIPGGVIVQHTLIEQGREQFGTADKAALALAACTRGWLF